MRKMAVIYWSGTGNTQAMAEAIAAGATSAGAEVSLFNVAQIQTTEALSYDLLALGCPSMGSEVLEEGEFEPFFSALKGSLSGKKVALFGSYGWGDGQWMRDWQDSCIQAGALLFKNEGLIINETPDSAGIEACKSFGSAFAAF